MKAFKSYDIRGIWGKELNEQIAYRIGAFIPSVFSVEKVLIGRDMRLSSPVFFESLTKGLITSGVEVYDAGVTTTPMIYWGTGKYSFDLSIMITASHNSKEYNGLKFSGKHVAPIGYNDGLNTLEKLVESDEEPEKKPVGSIVSFNFEDDYLKFLMGFANDYSDLKISLDCSNGVAGLFAKRIFGENTIYINSDIDGSFPSHEPNPLEPENQIQIKEAVKLNNSDVGVVFDGDADRVMFIDENGSFISPDLIIALLGDYFFKEKNSKGRVVQDIRTSKSVGEYLSKYDVSVDIWKVGRAFGAAMLKEVDGIYGGELAGHYYFRDFYYSDSGMLAAIIVLNILKNLHKEGTTISEAIDKISTYANTGEVNFTIEKKQEAMDAVVDHFKKNDTDYIYYDFDGYRLEFDNWWFNIRPSNTEPYLRFLAEATSEELLNTKTDIIYKILSEFQ